MSMENTTTDASCYKSLEVTPTRGYSPHFGFNRDDFVRWKKLLTLDQARQQYDSGQKFSLIFGDPVNPDYFMDIYQGNYETKRRIDIQFLSDMKWQKSYIVEYDPVGFGDSRNEMLLVQYTSDIFDDQGRRAFFFVADVFHGSDLPRIEYIKDSIVGENRRSISVPWQDFYIGAPPSFDQLIDGSFVARLPKITLPPEELLEPFLPRDAYKKIGHKRTPRGRFPW